MKNSIIIYMVSFKLWYIDSPHQLKVRIVMDINEHRI